MRPPCGYAVSFCLICIGAWGFIQLSVMSILYRMNCVTLMHDIPRQHHYESVRRLYESMGKGYKQNSFSCLVACLIYLVILLVSAFSFALNRIEMREKEAKQKKKTNQPTSTSPSTAMYNQLYAPTDAKPNEGAVVEEQTKEPLPTVESEDNAQEDDPTATLQGAQRMALAREHNKGELLSKTNIHNKSKTNSPKKSF